MICFSFDSCGWMHFFHFGVARYLIQKFDCTKFSFAGSSAGSFIALCLCAGVPIDVCISESIRNLKLYRKNPFNICSYLSDSMHKILPKDAYKKCDGRLFISITESVNGKYKNCLISSFSNNEELVDAVVASCYLMPYAGITLYKNKYLDGGYTNKLPEPINHRTIRISASGKCNSDIRNSIFFPITIGMFPPSLDILKNMYDLGYLEAYFYFEQNKDIYSIIQKYRNRIYYFNIYRIILLVCIFLFIWYCMYSILVYNNLCSL